jgi:hypothetical protein
VGGHHAQNYCVVPCEEGDFVFLLSNGAWRNLQPFYLRHDITAADREADYPFLAHCPHHRTWAEVQGDRLLHPWDTAVTLPLLARCLARASADGLSAEAIVRAFVDHAQQATQPVHLTTAPRGHTVAQLEECGAQHTHTHDTHHKRHTRVRRCGSG